MYNFIAYIMRICYLFSTVGRACDKPCHSKSLPYNAPFLLHLRRLCVADAAVADAAVAFSALLLMFLFRHLLLVLVLVSLLFLLHLLLLLIVSPRALTHPAIPF